MDIYSRLLAAINRYEEVDDNIQQLQSQQLSSEKHMISLLGEMSQIKETLCSCHDDHQRLILIFNKVLMQTHNFSAEVMPNDSADTGECVDEQSDRIEDCSIDHAAADEESKDFFALNEIKDDDSDDERAAAQSRKQRADELESYDSRVTRLFYAPVLKQLKSKIDPIKADMRERELKFLLSKGIDREQILNFDSDAASDASETSRSSETSSAGRRKNCAGYQDRYASMRTQLENKQQFCFLSANLPTNRPTEDILEWNICLN